MSFKISYYSLNGRHITLKEDGRIEMYVGLELPILIDYQQAQILKKMILTQAKLEKAEK